MEKDPPHGAKVNLDINSAMTGWNCPDTPEYLETAIQKASKFYYGNDACTVSEGGSIPFMNLLA